MARAKTFDHYPLSGHHAKFWHFFKKKCLCKESLILCGLRRVNHLAKQTRRGLVAAHPDPPSYAFDAHFHPRGPVPLPGLLHAGGRQDCHPVALRERKVYTLENVLEMTVGMGAAGPGGNQETNMTQTMTITVKDEPGTANRLATVKFAAIKASMKMAGQTMVYDSADTSKSLPFLQQAFGALLGKEFTLVYDKDDKVIEARGMDTMTATPVGGARSMDGKQMVEAFKKSQEMFLPPQPVAPGDTWNYEAKVEMPPVGNLSSKGTGKFDSIVDVDGRKHAKLAVTGTLAMSESTTPANLGNDSTVTVDLLYDLERRVADVTTTTNDVKINAAGQQVAMRQKDITKVISIADAKVDAPKPDAPKADAPKPESPAADAPKADAPKVEAPKADAPKDAPK